MLETHSGISLHMEKDILPTEETEDVTEEELVSILQKVLKRMVTTLKKQEIAPEREIKFWCWLPHDSQTIYTIRFGQEKSTIENLTELTTKVIQHITPKLLKKGERGEQTIHVGVKDVETEMLFDFNPHKNTINNIFEMMNWPTDEMTKKRSRTVLFEGTKRPFFEVEKTTLMRSRTLETVTTGEGFRPIVEIDEEDD